MSARRFVVVLAGLSLLALGAIATLRLVRRPHIAAVNAANVVGDATCLSCHTDKATFESTAHRLTSRLPTPESIAGSFHGGENVVRTSNPRLHFRMDSTARGFYETAVFGRGRDTTIRAERIAYVTGVRKGQSYIYWHGDRLYQLPISYWSGVGWANSPGYPDGRPNFERAIPPRCLECHATYFESVADPNAVNRYRSAGAILGITCETCHGAGREHVRNRTSVLHALLPSAIVNPAQLPRTRQVQACALCHSGTAPLQTAAFTHVPGDPVRKQFDMSARVDTGTVDVHGNQVALLERSRCFRNSQMTCATCHDVHREQRDLADMSGRCLSCHRVQSCGLFPSHGQRLAGRCVDCHMPDLTSMLIAANAVSGHVEVRVRTHDIAVYPAYRDLDNVEAKIAAEVSERVSPPR